LLGLLALCLVAGGKEKPLGFEFCKVNGGFETEAYICASDNYRLVADVGVWNGDCRPLFAEKGTYGELAHV